MIFNEIYEFCKIRDIDRNQFSNRAKFLVDLLTRLNIEHKVFSTWNEIHQKYFHNIYCFGTSDKFLSAHYDIVNIEADNANDNSASVINAIAYKLKNPSINLLILDGEEYPYMGEGSTNASKYLIENKIPVQYILNLELTGYGRTFFIDNVKTALFTKIRNLFPAAFVIPTPFNDALIFRHYGFNSNVITCVNTKDGITPDMSGLYETHSLKDSVDKMSIKDMQNFVDNVLDSIIKD